MEIKSKIILKKKKEESLLRFHPWVFSGAVKNIEGSPANGDWVNIYSAKDKFLGAGHYQNKGSISVRIMSFEECVPDIEFWKRKLSDAYKYRKEINLPSAETNSYRLIYGEGDGLPGLIIDIYDKTAVIQAHSAGVQNDRKIIAEALLEVIGEKINSVYFKSESSGNSINEYLHGNTESPSIITENSNKFYVDWINGQKTGFFIDQRENRKLLSEYSNEKKVLNTFCYTGGFSVYAIKAEANLVHSVDSSKSAVELTNKNIELNFPNYKNHEAFTADVFEFLEENKNKYNLIILDPPAFAKHKDARHNAIRGYQRLNTLAIKNIEKGGIIFTFSCSQVISREMFYRTIMSASIIAKRKVKVLHHLSQAPDHPVSVYHPEGEYLKGVVLYIE
ncbi:MAG: class I SAM-dependent rRNA methyltransferase [Bacteroidales bacterium]|nr:class I SAM-dependent rRNA methyltransferase [Bacteroidales bacterium]